MESDDSGNYRISRRDYFAGRLIQGIATKEFDIFRYTVAEKVVQVVDDLIKELDKND